MTSSEVSVELSSNGQPLEPKKLLLLDQYGRGFRHKVLGDQNLNAFVFDALVCRNVRLTSVGIDRYRGVTASAHGSEVIKGDRAFTTLKVFSRCVRD